MSDLGTHPRKRSRQDGINASEDAEGVARTRDEEFWFDDGSIILIARNVEFRVYKGLLADHSPVFRDMFSLPQPPISEGELETPCPVVHLSDSAEDVRCLLRVCMPKTDFKYDPTYESIASSIRLGHKYQIATLVNHAVGYLKEYYTDDYGKWKSHKMGPPPRFQLVHAIGVVNLARLIECDSILPTAILHCCQLGAAGRLVSGLPRADGTTEHLSASDLALCFSAIMHLARAWVTIALRVRAPTKSPSCYHPIQCMRTFATRLNGPHIDEEKLCYPNPFYSFGYLFTGFSDSVCTSCYAMLCKRDVDERKDLWARLPATLGLHVAGWPEATAATDS
ncbi:hypothetical protein L226DRAFT_466512 [Lentinus tigrinus ALCF2SS1-7]|uniref:BTB domain-containing protein n=1 Tax=Lentinus tigrinus ALCF2SS1-6 TaxID=1328759 RepID=A0A5C2S5R5_9APHY|nr:hypothetical protein L227DRAFT_505040 [Lentinus tigrinus ALCF2SS1-6]RPD72814.1 hypothetical protein L226DRAFT_466512 [Lentinus tigrinus ALCF2SS1-7]